jgi:hypothetical protein
MTWNSNGRNEGAMIGLVVGMVWLAVGVTSCTGDSSDSPPPAAPETVAGIDANGDGIRDDIEVYIDATYPVSTQGETNRALRQFALGGACGRAFSRIGVLDGTPAWRFSSPLR